MTAATDVAVGRMRQDARLRILLIEDDQNDAELLHACLAEAVRGGAEIVHAASLAKALRVLESQTIHITVLDLDLPDSAGLPTLEKAGAAARGPVIVVTGNPHPALVPEALERGAYEVLKKSELDARSLMRIVRLASIQSQTERSLRLTERRYRALIENSREAIGLFGSRGELLYGNPAMRKLLWSGSNLIELVHPFERESVQAEYARLVAAPEGRVTRKAHFRYHDGSWRMLEAALRNRLQDGDVAAVVANFTDVTSQVDLEERFRATFDQAAVGIAHVAHDGCFQLVNRKLCEILGYSREELAALTVFEVSHAEDREVTVALRRKMRAREIDSFSAVKRYLRKDGSAVWVEVNVSLVRAADGSPSYEIALFEDISLRRQAEEALQRSERRFRALIENSSDGILLADGEGRMLYASPGARRVLGYANGETLGWQIADLVHPEERCALDGMVAAARAQRGETQPLRLRARHKDASYRLLEGTCTDLRADESVRAVVFNFRDITEREDAQARVRDSEARFRSLAELSSDWYWEQDAGERGEIPQEVLAARQPFRDFEYLRTEPDGERRYVSISGEPVLDEAGSFIGYRGTARDITERKRSELRMERLKTMYEALSSANEAILRAKSTEEMLSRACEIAVESGDFLLGTVFMLDPASGLLHRAAASGPISGEAEVLPASIHASQSGGQGLIGLACRTGRPAISNDYPADPRIEQARRAVRPYFIGSAAVYPLVVEGELAGVFGLQHADKGAFTGELTALLQRLADNISFALENLQREERYRTVVNSANEGILVYDRALNIIAANAAAERIIGVPASELIGKPGFTSLFACVREDGSPLPAEDRPARLTARTGQGMTGYVLGIVREDRSVTWLSVNTAFLRRADEQHSYGVVSTLSDITARRAAELALRESEERFRNLTELSTDWYWEQDEQLRFTRLYGGIFARIGIDTEALRGKLRWDLADVDTTTAEWRAHRAALERRESFRDFEYSMRLPGGERGHFSVSGHPVLDEAGAFRGYRGTGRDITARKQAEEELKRFRAALNASADSIFLVDADAMQIIDLNDAGAHSLGYERAELIGRNPDMLFEDRGDAELRAEYERLMASADGTQLLRAHFRRKDGSLVPVEGTRRLVRAAGRNYIVGIVRDITDRLKAEERLQQSLERFEIVARATNDVVYDCNLVTDQVWWNENFCTVFGYEPYEVGAYVDAWSSRIHPEDIEFVKGDVQASIDGGYKSWSGEYRFRRKDGSYAVVFDRGMVIRDSAGKPVRMIGALVDVTARKEAERKIALHTQRQEIIARLGQFALGQADLDAVLAEAARGLRAGGCDVAAVVERLGGESREFLMRAACGEDAGASVGKRAAVKPDAKWAVLLESEGAVAVHDRKHFESRRADTPWASWLRRLGSGVYAPIRGESGAFGVLMMGAWRDNAFDAEDLSFAETIAHVLSAAVRRHQTQTRLAYMAEFDGLTGLPNRNLLHDRLTQSLAQASRREWQGAVLFIDLDRFKLVNDTLGHHVGDRLIAEVGRRLQQCLRAGDTVGRVSGDEFGVVLAELAQADHAAIVAQKILDALACPFDLGGNEAYVTASIGISVFPSDGADAETLLKNADMAMYRAKELTRNAYCFFTGEMNQRSVAKLQLNTDLRRAIERREFVLHYQPKIDLADGRLDGVEALLRWNHPQRGMVSPADFIPALEDSGLILPVGEWVLEEAAAQLRAWQREGLRPVPVSVNLSAKQFRRRDLDALIHRTLSAAGVPATLIELEITESCLMEDPEDAVRLLASLRGAGLRISVDDFGTGYSSLSYLTRLPLNALKIDRSFVRDAVSSGEAASIVRAVIDMAHNLSFIVVAEGVETAEQMAFLQRHRCDLGQGYLFARPMPAAQLAERLKRAA